MSNMAKLSESIISVANEKSYGITNLQLQKIMYFTLIDGLSNKIIDKDFINEIYDEKFEAWKYGPVIPSIHNLYKNYGATFIIENTMFDDTFIKLKDIIIDLLETQVFDLIEESYTHKLWKENKNYINEKRFYTGIKYEIQDLLDFN